VSGPCRVRVRVCVVEFSSSPTMCADFVWSGPVRVRVRVVEFSYYIQLYSPECTLAENININNNKQNKDRNILINTISCAVYKAVLVACNLE